MLGLNLIDNGLSNFFALETLRHGTNPINAVSIHFTGGNPAYGGTSTGSGSTEDTPGYFFLTKDSEMPHLFNTVNSLSRFYAKIPSCASRAISRRLFPKFFCGLSSYNWAKQTIGDPDQPHHPLLSVVQRILCFSLSILGVLITPTLKFRFKKIEPHLEEDPMTEQWAYKTAQKVEWWRIGTLGTLVTGLNLNWVQRAKENPAKVLTGIIQLAIGAALLVTALSLAATQAHLIAMLALEMVLA